MVSAGMVALGLSVCAGCRDLGFSGKGFGFVVKGSEV